MLTYAQSDSNQFFALSSSITSKKTPLYNEHHHSLKLDESPLCWFPRHTLHISCDRCHLAGQLYVHVSFTHTRWKSSGLSFIDLCILSSLQSTS